jgi:hypothetical protein
VADLIALADLSAYLQRTVDPTSGQFAINIAQGLVRREARQNFDLRTYTAVALAIVEATGKDARDIRLSASRLPRIWSSPLLVRLPQRPVTAVAAVSINGTALTANVDWAWDGASPKIVLSRVPYTANVFQTWPNAVVTYTAGWSTVPDDVKGIVAAVAGRAYDNPRGLRSRSIDDYSETKAGSDDDLAGVTLLREEKLLLKPFRRTTLTVGG